MEQPCYKCGQAVEEGIPFCPHCGAPQIRVLIAEPVPSAAPVSDVLVAGQSSAPLPASQTIPMLALPTPWSRALKPCGLAALVAYVLMALGLHPFVALLSVGFLAVVFYRHGRPGTVVKATTGAWLGVLSGVLCFGVMALLGALAATVSDFRVKIREQLMDNAQKWAASHPSNPQVQVLLEQLKTPEGLVMVLIVGSIMLFVVSVVLAGLGGVLGGSILSRRDRS